MSTLYSLLVGIDRYGPPVRPLRGCGNDVDAMAAYLGTRRSDGDPDPLILRDGEATRARLIEALRTHLGQAGPDDTALFYFSGHGSEAPIPPELEPRSRFLEPGGTLQTLICADSRQGGVPDLYDKELAILLGAVADRGAHVVAVLDCCHAAGLVRLVYDEGGRDRVEYPSTDVPRLDQLLPELIRFDAELRASTVDPGYVLLAACASTELSQEIPLADGSWRGAFSVGLLSAVNQLGPTATYRELITATRAYVETIRDRQVPELLPVVGTRADQSFLGRHVRMRVAPMTMRCVRGGWEINAGRCHGMVAESRSDDVRVGVVGPVPVREARIVRVGTARSVVEAIGWTPDPTRQYPVVLTRVALPTTTVAVDGEPRTAAAFSNALATSPHVRTVDPSAPAELRVDARPGGVRILSATGDPLTDGYRVGDWQAVTDLEHIARWRRLRALHNPLTRIGSEVHLEFVEALPDDTTVPMNRPALRPGRDGRIELRYRRTAGGWTSPAVFIRMRNVSDRPLYCALLDLTDRFRISADLFPGEFIAAHGMGVAQYGRPVDFHLPPDRQALPGALVHDWIMLLVSEKRFEADAFELPRLREVEGTLRSSFTGVLDQLGFSVLHRDVGPPIAPPTAEDWTATTVPVITVVPKD